MNAFAAGGDDPPSPNASRPTMSSTDFDSGTPIKGAVALVTGGNRGFGRALVDELLERGAAKVYATSRSAHYIRHATHGSFR
jgi:3-oxoacyl-ACP reductase-like protein